MVRAFYDGRLPYSYQLEQNAQIVGCLGLRVHESQDAMMLVGFDAGVYFRTVHHSTDGFTHTLLSDASYGDWPIARHLDAAHDLTSAGRAEIQIQPSRVARRAASTRLRTPSFR
jgi:hypothetical protein